MNRPTLLSAEEMHALSIQLASRLDRALERNELGVRRVVLMHDFSLDWIVRVSAFEVFVEQARGVFQQGGGLLPDSTQAIQQGGCAANCATTVARLGLPTHFICRTDRLGFHLIDYYLGAVGVNLEHVKTNGDHARVMVLEVGEEATNVMVNDQRSFTPFGFDDLDADDLALIDGADLVGVFDWTLNSAGTDLASRLFDRLATGGPITYLDTSDPAPRRGEIDELFDRVLAHQGLHYLNINEHELRQYCGAETMAEDLEQFSRRVRDLDSRLSAGLAVHTSRFSCAPAKNGVVVIPAYDIVPRRSTGAGDTWNGGNIAALLLELALPERLLMANAVAAYYVESEDGSRPDLTQLIEFLRTRSKSFRAGSLAQ